MNDRVHPRGPVALAAMRRCAVAIATLNSSLLRLIQFQHVVSAARASRTLVMESNLDILYEDNHCLAVAKPSGVLSARTSRARRKRSTARQGVPQGEVPQARQRLPRRRPPARPAGLRRAAVRPHQQGGGPAVGAVPRGHRREGLLGRRRGRRRQGPPARSKTGC